MGDESEPVTAVAKAVGEAPAVPDLDPCELCGTPAEPIGGGGFGVQQRCPQCGEFKHDRTGIATIRKVPQPDKAKLSGWVRDQNILGDIPDLSDERIRHLVASPMPSIGERADRLLSYAIRKHPDLGNTFTTTDPALIAVTYSHDAREVGYLVEYLRDEDLIRHKGPGNIWQITPAGHMRYDERQARQPASAQGFVAMWFDETMRDAYIDLHCPDNLVI